MAVMKPNFTTERERPLVENSIRKSFESPRILTITGPSMPTSCRTFAETVYSEADRSFVILKPLASKKFSMRSPKSAKSRFFPTQRPCILKTPRLKNLLSTAPLNFLSWRNRVQTEGIVTKLTRSTLLKLISQKREGLYLQSSLKT